jgi:hypothetical protein
MRGAFVLFVLLCSGCSLYDEGDRFASQLADFAWQFRASPETTATFEYVPVHGNAQHVRAGIGRIRFCPKTPCDGSWTVRLSSGEERTYYQGAATVWVEHGNSGTGYRIASAASVPEPLQVEKNSGPIRVHLRKMAGLVEIVDLD